MKLFCYELTHATKYITAVCIKNILGKRLLLCGDFTFYVSYPWIYDFSFCSISGIGVLISLSYIHIQDMCPISGIVRVLISLLWSLREISLSYLYVSDLWNSRFYFSIPTLILRHIEILKGKYLVFKFLTGLLLVFY